MRVLKRIAAAASVAALAITIGSMTAGTATAQEPLKLKIGTEGAYPPFNFIKPDGTLSGFDVDIARALCEEMKAECEFVTQEWDGAIPALQSGKFDAFIASMSITDERKKQVDFSNKYYNTPPGIAAPKDTDIKGVTKEDLAGKTIGVQVSTTHANYSEKTFTDSTIKAYPTAEEYRLDLANGRLDAVNDDSVTLAEWLKTPDGACCKMVGTFPPVIEIHGPGAGVAFKNSTKQSKRSAQTVSTRKSTTSTLISTLTVQKTKIF
jgi:polar amino acid transport system substrate-binding protein